MLLLSNCGWKVVVFSHGRLSVPVPCKDIDVVGARGGELVDFVSCDPATRPRAKRGVVALEQDTRGFALICLLSERGQVSGHCYQPRVNHRALDMTVLISEHKSAGELVMNPAMVDTLCRDDEDYSFSVTPVSLYPYEAVYHEQRADEPQLVFANTDGSNVLRSHLELKNPKEHSDLSNVQAGCRPAASNRTAAVVSGKCFKQALAVVSLVAWEFVASLVSQRDQH